MKNLIIIIFIAFFNKNFAQTAYFTTDPTLTPDAKAIIFAFEGDLWKVPASGGQAFRITAMQGDETKPAVSPDGKWLAFTGTQFGNKDVFIMPMNGGDIKRLTFHEAQDEVENWAWDSQEIIFTSNRFNRFTAYKINVDGTTPKRIFPHFFNTVHDVVVHPKTNEIFFNESWESKNFAHRKRYKGAYNPDIQSFNFATNKLTKYTNYDGKDFGATLDQNGSIYFMSDEDSGEYQLYTLQNQQKKKLTNFSSSIFFPKVSANGEKIVFRKDYQIYVFDVKSGKTIQPEIQITRNPLLTENKSFNLKGNITAFDISPNQKLMALVSRGRLFVSDVKGKLVKEIKTNSKEAVDEVKFLKDNTSVIYSQTVDGFQNYFIQHLTDGSEPKTITKDVHKNRNLTLNSDRTKAVFYSGKKDLKLIDLQSLNITTIAKGEFWSFRGSNPSFSPDGNYILFSQYQNFEQEIMLYHLPTQKLTNVSRTRVSENDPVFSPDGKYIYFATDRFQPSYPRGTTNEHIYRIALQRTDEKFRTDKFQDLFKEDKKEEKSTATDKNSSKTDEKSNSKKSTTEIEEEGIMKRIEKVSPGFGEQSNPYVYQKDGKTTVFYLSNHQGGKTQLWKTVYEDFEDPKTEAVSSKTINEIAVAEVNNQLYTLINGTIHTISGDKLEEVAIDFDFNKNLQDEFQQMYYETWAALDQNFYDEKFHGENWEKRKEQYAKFLPYVNNRSDLRLLLNDLLGELNTSHFGFNSRGEEEKLPYKTNTLATGIEFNNDQPFVVERVIKNSPADLKRLDLNKGDQLVSVNGINIQEGKNRESYFVSTDSKQELEMQFKRDGKLFSVKLHPTTSAKITDLLYDEWQQNNEKYVDQKSNKTVAYVHMKDMTEPQLEKFLEKMVSDDGNRNGLIVDLRYNTGGNVHDAVLKFLSQKPYLKWKYRDGAITMQPNFSPSANPIVMLINQQSLSDAEVTSNGFKELQLGTLVGTETYRWIIFTTSGRLVDGSTYRLPSWGCYSLDGKNLEATGVAPDVFVDETLADRLKGNQPQLDKALEIIMKKRKN